MSVKVGLKCIQNGWFWAFLMKDLAKMTAKKRELSAVEAALAGKGAPDVEKKLKDRSEDLKISASTAPAKPLGAPEPEPIGGVAHGHRRQIAITMTPDQLARVDEIARRMGQSRTTVINLAVYQALEKGLIG